MDFSDLREEMAAQGWPEKPNDVQIEGVVGSQAYGLATDNSDEDRMGVFMVPSDELLGLDEVAQSVKNPWADEVLYELGKFCRLALKSNPTVTEILWLEDYTTLTAIGKELVDLRGSFLSAGYCRNAYFGYAVSQFGDLKSRPDGTFSADLRNRTAKHARHLARLLVSGYGLWSTGHLQVRLEDPAWFFAFGDRVADGDLTEAEQMLADYEELFNNTTPALPAEPDRDLVDAWLRDVRARQLERPATRRDLMHAGAASPEA